MQDRAAPYVGKIKMNSKIEFLMTIRRIFVEILTRCHGHIRVMGVHVAKRTLKNQANMVTIKNPSSSSSVSDMIAVDAPASDPFRQCNNLFLVLLVSNCRLGHLYISVVISISIQILKVLLGTV